MVDHRARRASRVPQGAAPPPHGCYSDDDLAELMRRLGHMLQELKLDKCSGFTMDKLQRYGNSSIFYSLRL
jgi:hypothetical protein